MNSIPTPCEEYGHEFKDGCCRDCGEHYEEIDEDREDKNPPNWLLTLLATVIFIAGGGAIVGLGVWGVVSLVNWADNQDRAFAEHCSSMGGHVLTKDNVVTTYGYKGGVGVGTTSVTYCLSSDGRVLDIE